MDYVYAEYNPMHNSIDINHYDGYIIRHDCNKVEDGLKTTPGCRCALNALAIDNPLLYATMYLEGSMQSWIACEDNSICF